VFFNVKSQRIRPCRFLCKKR